MARWMSKRAYIAGFIKQQLRYTDIVAGFIVVMQN